MKMLRTFAVVAETGRKLLPAAHEAVAAHDRLTAWLNGPPRLPPPVVSAAAPTRRT